MCAAGLNTARPSPCHPWAGPVKMEETQRCWDRKYSCFTSISEYN